MAWALVDVNICDDEVATGQARRLVRAAEQILITSGYEFETSTDPEIGSWFQKLVMRFPRRVDEQTKEHIAKTYEEVRQALREEFISRPEASNARELATAARELAAALHPFDNVVLRMGKVIAAKATHAGQTYVLIELMTEQLAKELEAHPQLMTRPYDFIMFLKDQNRAPGIIEIPPPDPDQGE